MFGHDFTFKQIFFGVFFSVILLQILFSTGEMTWSIISCIIIIGCIQEKQKKLTPKEAQEKAQEKEEREQREVYSGFCQHCGRKRTLLKKIRTEYYQSAYVYVCPRHGI